MNFRNLSEAVSCKYPKSRFLQWPSLLIDRREGVEKYISQDMAANKPFDNSIFDLPDWAKNQRASWNGIEKNGESSKGPTAFSTNNMNGGKHYQSNGADDIGNNDDGGDQEEDETNSLGLSEQDEIWEDAEEKLGIDPETGQFTVDELKVCRPLNPSAGLLNSHAALRVFDYQRELGPGPVVLIR